MISKIKNDLAVRTKRVINFVCLFLCLQLFQHCNDSDAVSKEKEPDRRKMSEAVSCTPNGLSKPDSILYMHGGGAEFKETVPGTQAAPKDVPDGMVWIPGGEFSMGGVNPAGMNDGGHEQMNDARPVHRVFVSGFLMDATEVTNKAFAAFVKATNYRTVAEQQMSRDEFPGVAAEDLVPGSIVFSPTRVNNLDDPYAWWRYVKGADWKHPSGPGSNIAGKEDYPVVHISWEDAMAYAKWSGKRLPTEAEWELAARGNKAGELYTWGNQLRPEGKWMANIFQGEFPVSDRGADGFTGIAPVKQFSPNSFGLYDMAGNVWEWCSDWYSADYYRASSGTAVASNPQGPSEANDPNEPGVKKKVQRGGSFLCTDQYCTRYMVGTRGKGEYRSGTNHVGFRCVKDLSPAGKAK